MCVVSMITDHYIDEWSKRLHPSPVPPSFTPYPATPLLYPVVPAITPEEIAEFRRLLERAREYDRRNNEPDCGMEEKKTKLRKLAEELGATISFE